MRIILLSDVENLGKKGEIKEVSNGYARNFLIPKKLALPANQGVIKNLENQLKTQKAKKDLLRKEACEIKGKIEGQIFTLSKRVGPKGKIFGSVTHQEIAEIINQKTGIQIDKKQIEEEPIKELGEYKIKIKLFDDIVAEVRLNVVAQKKNKK